MCNQSHIFVEGRGNEIFEFIELEKVNLMLLKPLWEQLNEIHVDESTYFSERFEAQTFENRCSKFYELTTEELSIIAVMDSDKIIGYSITTVDEETKTGELESIFIYDDYRGNGIGKELVERSILWMKERGSKKIQLAVAEGHEEVVEFYMKSGFYPRLKYLELKE